MIFSFWHGHHSMDLPSNLGLTVGPNIDYVLVKTFNPYTASSGKCYSCKALLENILNRKVKM